MKPMPIVYVSDMDRSLEFYRALCPEAKTLSASPYWSQLVVEGADLALHHVDELPAASKDRVELAFSAEEGLEGVAARLAGSGYELARGITDEAFGRSLVVADPDGYRIQVNEHDPELYPS